MVRSQADDTSTVAAECDRVISGAYRKSSRHEGRSRRCALRLNHVMRQLGAFACKRIHSLSVGAAENAAAVAPKLTHAKVIDMEE